jgi:hypothetical protein
MVDAILNPSRAVDDPKIETLMAWIIEHGGSFNVEVRENIKTGVRGIYSSEDLKDNYDDKIIIKIPNKLIISPLHTRSRQIGSNATFGDIFDLAKELFDPQYPYEQNQDVPTKMENAYGEYFQVTLFLIMERLRGDASFWKPFFDSLPAKNETFFTIDEQAKIQPGSTITLLSEV